MTSKIKHADELTIEDFRQYPIWGWLDEDGDNPNKISISPSKLDEVLGGIDRDILFFHCKYYLNDGSRFEGYIGIVLSQRRPFTIAIAQLDKLESFSLSMILRKEFSAEDFAHQLGRNVDQVFPLLFSTEFKYLDGMNIEGSIEI